MAIIAKWLRQRGLLPFADVVYRLLHLLSVLLLFVLVLASAGFLRDHPLFAAGIITLFSLAYLYAGTKEGMTHFLYPGLLFGAVAYFLLCNAAGASTLWFPALSVPLVWALWLVGHRVRRDTVPEGKALDPVSRTLFRAMSVTAAAFSVLALLRIGSYISVRSSVSFVPAIAFYGFSALYLSHRWKNMATIYGCVGSAYLLAAGLCLAWVSPLPGADLVGPIVAAGILLMVLVSTHAHHSRNEPWTRPYYAALAIMGAVDLIVAASSPYRWLLTSACLSCILGFAYYRMVWAVKSVRDAAVWERAWARAWLYCSVAIGTVALLVPVFARPVHVEETVVCGVAYFVLFCVHATKRPNLFLKTRNVSVYLAVAWLSIMLIGPISILSMNVRAAAAPAAGMAVMVGLAILQSRSDDERVRLSATEAVLLPCSAALLYTSVGAGGFSAAPSFLAAIVMSAAVIAFGAVPARRAAIISLGVTLAAAYIAGVLWATGMPAAARLWMPCGALVAWMLHMMTQKRWLFSAVASLIAWLLLSGTAVSLAFRANGAGSVEVLALATWIAVAAIVARGSAGDESATFYRAVLLAARAIGVLGIVVSAIALGSLSAAAMSCAALGIGYLVAAAAAANEKKVVPAALLLSSAWVMETFATRLSGSVQALSVVVLIVVLHTLSYLLRQKWMLTEACLRWTGRLATYFLLLAALYVFRTDVTPLTVCALLLCAAVIAVFLLLRQRREYLFDALLLFSFGMLFALALIAGEPYLELLLWLTILSCAWVTVGWGLRKRGKIAYSTSFFEAAIVLAMTSALLNVFMPGARCQWQVFLLSGLIAVVLFGILGKPVLLYFVTVSLALLMYRWMQESASPFTSAKLFYLLIGLLAIGFFFLLPHLRRLATHSFGAASMTIFTWRGALVLALPVAACTVVLLSTYAAKLAEHPRFCSTCHNMTEYYDSWEHSSHKDVVCITCHYDPGIEAVVKGKINGMVQLVKYVSHSYSGKPHAEISDASCMRAGCHVGMQDDSTELLFKDVAMFNHEQHLSGRVPGHKLHCTSCHFQSVPGEHISVTSATCITCHFYNRGSEPVGAGTCLTCHRLPEEAVEFAGAPFSHKDFLADNDKARCVSCHSAVTKGTGTVSWSRCLNCHAERYELMPPQTVFHGTHVSKRRIECLQCHDPIEHGTMSMSEQMLASANCSACHGESSYTLQEKVYAGVAADGLEPEPDVMYAAGVSCAGCHLHEGVAVHAKGELGQKAAATRGCIDCHGETAYGAMLDMWQTDVRETVAELKGRMQQLYGRHAALESDGVLAAEPGLASELDTLRERTEADVAMVETDGSLGVHNYPYITAILDRAATDLDRYDTLLAQAVSASQDTDNE